MELTSNRGSLGQLSSSHSEDNAVVLGVMHHSLSTPAGVDSGARTPPTTPKKWGKLLAFRVQMLDDTITIFQVQAKALGSVLFEQVCKQLHLLEADYFGLEYVDSAGTKYWLDLQKPLSRQLGLSLVDPLFYFCVKFYTPDPSQLEEEFTRYLFCLQIKRDLAQGLIQCNENTAALMASYIVQAECGDYVAEDYPDHTYLSTFKFTPLQDREMERRIMENHKKHAGQSPAEADLNLLETARRCELYGVKMHQAKDHEGVTLNLAVAHMGLLVFQNYTKINTFSWAKIRKISFKRKRFLVKLHPEGYGFYKDTVEFFFEGRNECKNFWKKCVENHGFFRCTFVKHIPRHKTRVLSRGSSFRYSGKTQKQIIEFVRDNYVKRQAFQRSASFRHTSVHSSASNMHPTTVGNSISAHPLLPLGDSNLSVEVSKLSAMSMGGPMAGLGSPTTRSVSLPRGTVMSWRTDHVKDTEPSTPTKTNALAHRPTMQSETTWEDRGETSSATENSSPLQRVPKYTSTGREVIMTEEEHEAALKADTDDQKLNRINGNLDKYNKSLFSSTPNGKSVNGDISFNNADEGYDIQKMKNLSPIQNLSKEQILNSINEHNNNNCTNTTTIIAEIEGDVTRKPKYIDKGYYIAKEILMTEIVYKKDLEILNEHFRTETSKSSLTEFDALFSLIKLMTEGHEQLLKNLEQRLQEWDVKGKAALCKIADVLLKHLPPLMPIYNEYVEEHMLSLERVNYALKQNTKFSRVYREFESQKVCYLPLSTFILKPLHRLVQYRFMLNRLWKHCGPNHPDRYDCISINNCLKNVVEPILDVLEKSENFAILLELQKDLIGFENLVQANRKFIRHGCLLKLSGSRYKQKMFFLFSDILLYATRSQATLYFKVHNQIPLNTVTLREPEGELASYGLIIDVLEGSHLFVVAANSLKEKEQWNADLKGAMIKSKENPNFKVANLDTFKSYNFLGSDEVIDQCGNNVGTQTKILPQRSNSAVHVCWHRNTSIGMQDCLLAVEHQLAGFLLRKFKSSNGWQKLWVVFTSFCLFFYKGHSDKFPLASLPLLGYTVGPPDAEDCISKDFVFKLQYKNHIYFFRAESEYTYNRWLETISNTTQSKHHKSLLQILNENTIESSPEK